MGACEKCKSHPFHPHSTLLGFIAALAPKVWGASLSLGFGRIILSVRDLRTASARVRGLVTAIALWNALWSATWIALWICLWIALWIGAILCVGHQFDGALPSYKLMISMARLAPRLIHSTRACQKLLLAFAVQGSLLREDAVVSEEVRS